MDKDAESDQRKTILDTRKNPGFHRCQSFGLGSDMWEIHDTGNLVEQKLHINVLELRVVYLALKHFTAQLMDSHILIRTDNTSAKAYIINQGGSRSSKLHKEALKTLHWVEANVQSMSAKHIKSISQHPSKLAEQATLTGGRMVSQQGVVPVNYETVRNSDFLPLHIPSQQPGTEVLQQILSPQGVKDRCSDGTMAPGPTICVSADPTSSQTLAQDKGPKGTDVSGGTILAKAPMVLGTPGHGHGTSADAPGITGDATTGYAVASEARLVSSDCEQQIEASRILRSSNQYNSGL